MAGITTATIVSLGLAAAKAGTGFAQASKQKKLQQKAEREADKFMADARKRLDVNYYESLALQKEPYERAREAILAQGAQALQAAQEAETRGVAATAGRAMMAGQEAQRDIAGAQAQELYGLQKLVAQEDARLAEIQAVLDLEESTGAQIAANEAARNRAQKIEQGFEGAGEFFAAGLKAAPLYGKEAAGRQLGRIERINERTGQYGSLQDIKNTLAQQGTLAGIDVSGVGGMSELEFQDFIGQQNREFGKAFRSDVLNLNAFNPFSIFKSQ